VCSSIVETVRSAVSKEHALRLTHIILVRPRTIPKTTSGKIARAWTRKAFLKGTLNVVYKQTSQESFHVGRVESSSNAPPSAPRKKMDAAKIRSLDNATLLKKLVKDVSRVGSVPVESIDKDAPLTTILDSMSLSQFKGMLEGEYATRLSDEYLFREATTLNKLVEVVKLGYAPDDDGQPAGPGAASAVAHSPGQAGGLAGALGCPPGVVCCVVM
jgi:acyl carrier protein